MHSCSRVGAKLGWPAFVSPAQHASLGVCMSTHTHISLYTYIYRLDTPNMDSPGATYTTLQCSHMLSWAGGRVLAEAPSGVGTGLQQAGRQGHAKSSLSLGCCMAVQRCRHLALMSAPCIPAHACADNSLHTHTKPRRGFFRGCVRGFVMLGTRTLPRRFHGVVGGPADPSAASTHVSCRGRGCLVFRDSSAPSAQTRPPSGAADV